MKNKYKQIGQTTFRLSIALSLASLFAIPTVSADSLSATQSSTQSATASESASTTENTSQSGGVYESNSTSSSSSDGRSASNTMAETKSQTQTADSPVNKSWQQTSQNREVQKQQEQSKIHTKLPDWGSGPQNAIGGKTTPQWGNTNFKKQPAWGSGQVAENPNPRPRVTKVAPKRAKTKMVQYSWRNGTKRVIH